MNRTTTLLFATALLSCLGVWAQPSTPAYEFRSVVQPGATIGGHTFTPDTTILNAALNDLGEFAFIARLSEADGSGRAAVFTSQAIVASEDDVIDGKFIVTILPHAGLAINKAGQVAFEAVMSESAEAAREGSGEIGIFVDKHLALTPHSEFLVAFTLTDDGRVLLKDEIRNAPAVVPTPRKRPGLLGQIRITPRLPKDSPIRVAPRAVRLPERFGERPPLSGPLSPFEAMRVNRSGQVLIPVNLVPSGFILLLGTPTAEAPHAR